MWFGAKLECMLGLQAVKAKLVVASFVKNLIGTAIYLKVFFYFMAIWVLFILGKMARLKKLGEVIKGNKEKVFIYFLFI